MKPFETVLKVLTALAAVAGVVVVLAAYGDKIVAWAKKLMAKVPCHSCDIIEFTPAEDFDEEAENAPAEEAQEEAEEAPVEENQEEDVVTPAEGEPVADEEDFEA